MSDVDKVMQAIAARLGMPQGKVNKLFNVDPFTFVINYLPLAALNTATENFITQADSGFAIVKSSFTIASDVNVLIANISDTPKYAPQTITLTDSGSGRDLSNLAVSINTYFGSGERPFIWCRPKILDPNSTFTGRIVNLVNTAFNIRLSFHGFKIFGDVGLFRDRTMSRD